jgi:hypothetical protein
MASLKHFPKFSILISLILLTGMLNAQVRILFDATKAESAANADWVIDSDLFNLSWSSGPPVPGGGNEANPQQIPTPAQSGITSSTAENYWKGGISAWGVESVQQGFQVETLPYNGQITYGNLSNTQDLSNYKIFVLCEPNILFTAAEKTALMQFVQNGGGLFMVADHINSDRNNDGFDSPEILNDFMSNNGIQSNPFGITFDYANFSQTTSNIPNLPADPLLHGPMGNVTQAQWSGGTSITMSPASNSSVIGVVYKTGSSFGNSNVMVAYATYGSGKVVAIGDSSPCDDGTGDTNDQLYDGWVGDANGNHRILIMNATIWLAASGVTAPSVSTGSASGITTSSATLNGTINPNGASTNYYFQWGTTTSYGNSTATVSAGSGTSPVAVSANITGISTGTTYHFRLVATNSAGTTNGSDQVFTTAYNLPVVTTATPGSITTTTAVSGGTVSGTAIGSITARGVCWSTSANPDLTADHTSDGTGAGTFISNITGLSTGTVYHVRAYATNSSGTTYGNDLQFTTVAPTLSVSPSNQNVTSAAGSFDFAVTSNVNWSAVSDQTWCTVTATGSGNGIITAVYTENLLVAQRIANITVTVSGLSPVVVSIMQDAAASTLSVTPSNQNVTSNLGSTSFSVTSNTSWSAVSDQGWCSVTPSGTGNGTIIASYLSNTSSASRVAVVSVTAGTAAPVSVTVTQSGVTPPEFQYTIANDLQTSDKTFEFDLLLLDNDATQAFELGTVQAGIYVNSLIYNSGTITASILPGTSTLLPAQQPTSITFTQSANIIKLAAKAPPGTGNGSILSTNPASPSRICRVKLTNTVPWAQYSPNLTFCFTTTPYPTKISQYIAGINTPLTTNTTNCFSVCTNGLLNPPPVLSVTPANQNISSAAAITSFAINCNAGWTVSNDSPSWCSLNTASGFGNGNLIVTCLENTSSSSRIASIAVTVSGLSPVVVTVTQEGVPTMKTLNISAFLEGLYSGAGTMHPAMDENGIHWGTGVADQVTVQLRSSSNYSTVIYSYPAAQLLLDGSLAIQVPAAFNSNYYITLIHRNSIETVSALPVSFAGTTISYAFDQASKAYGDNLLQKADGEWVIYSGDVNQDGLVDSGDMIAVDNDSNIFATGYIAADVNGDGLVDSGDMIILDNNASIFVSKITP